jgi:hypothetical protein
MKKITFDEFFKTLDDLKGTSLAAIVKLKFK